MNKKLLLIPLSFISTLLNAQAPSGVKVTDMLRIQNVGNVTVSRDGSRAAFTVTTIEPVDKKGLDYQYQSQIYSVSLPDGMPQQLTFSRERATQPVWSPDGRMLAFVRNAEGKPQIFILPLNGGEAWQLTRSPYGATTPKWSPDGKKIAFAATVPLKELLKDSSLNQGLSPTWNYEKPGMEKVNRGRRIPDPDGSIDEIRAYLDDNVTDSKVRVLNKLNFHSETDVSPDLDFNQFFITDVLPGSKAKPLTYGFFRHGSLEFINGTGSVIYTVIADSLQHPDRAQENSIYIADTSGLNTRAFLRQRGRSFTSPRPSPSGKWLLFQQGGSSFVSQPSLSLIPLNGNSKDIVVFPFDRTITGAVWSADDASVYFTAQSNGGVPIYKLNIPARTITRLSADFDSGITSFDIANNHLIYSQTSVSNPSQLVSSDVALKTNRPIGSFNSWIANRQLSVPEKHSFENEKGMTVEYWVMKPLNYQPGKKFPLLLQIHGGPSAMWGPGETSMWHEFQYFCSQGYGIVYANPRGSGGYGLSFLKGNVTDWGTGPASDVLKAVDLTVVEGWADTSKLFLTGGSYGGYLVAWIISHDRRFRAAASERGVYDLATFFGEGNAWRLVPNYFGGYPWEPAIKSILDRESPISYVNNIFTPYIIFHGDQDRRTGFVQSEMLYRSLKVLGRPVEYVRHPGATHELTRSGDNRQRIDQMLRTYEFFERYLRSQP